MSFFRTWIFRAFAALVVVLLAAGAGWWFFIREDNKLATTAPGIPAELKSTGTAPAPGTPGSTAAGGHYSIVSAQSEAAYFAGEKLARVSLPSTAKGATKSIQGDFYLTPTGLDTTKESKFTVDLTTLKSDEANRDRQVNQRGLETSKFPSATFVATRLDGYPAEFPSGQEVAMKLTGMMDLHGVKKELTWDVKMRKEGDAISALATVNFKYADFNIAQISIGGFVSVDDNVTLQMQVVAKKS